MRHPEKEIAGSGGQCAKTKIWTAAIPNRLLHQDQGPMRPSRQYTPGALGLGDEKAAVSGGRQGAKSGRDAPPSPEVCPTRPLLRLRHNFQTRKPPQGGA